jgi:hypothetical protein
MLPWGLAWCSWILKSDFPFNSSQRGCAPGTASSFNAANVSTSGLAICLSTFTIIWGIEFNNWTQSFEVCLRRT